MAITYTAAMQNRIALYALGTPYANLLADQKTLQDGTWTTGSLTTGIAFDALNKVNQYGQWFEQVTTNVAPSVWEAYFVALTAYRLMAQYRATEKMAAFKDALKDAEDAAFNAYASSDLNSTTMGGQSFTVPGLRYYIIDHCIRREKRLFPSPLSMDAATQWMVNYVWNLQPWNFRKRQCTLRIEAASITTATWTQSGNNLTQTAGFNGWPASETVGATSGAMFTATGGTSVVLGQYGIATRLSDDALTLDSSLSATAGNLAAADIAGIASIVRVFGLDTGETADQTAIREFYYQDVTDFKLVHAQAEELAALRAYYGSSTGRPERFRLELRGSTLYWHLFPLPDQTYTLFGEMLAEGPGATGTATALTTALDRMPAKFHSIIREGVLARVLRNYDVKDGEAKWVEVDGMLKSLLAEMEDTGRSDDDVSIRDVYNDSAFQIGNSPWQQGGSL